MRCFNPRAPCGARHIVQAISNKKFLVSIHAPRAGRDRDIRLPSPMGRCFNPRAPCGARLGGVSYGLYQLCFNPRAPCGARPRSGFSPNLSQSFNPRAPCGARRVVVKEIIERHTVSIHAPRAGRDYHLGHRGDVLCVSIHAPRAGRDRVRRFMRGMSNVSIHAPRAGRDDVLSQR